MKTENISMNSSSYSDSFIFWVIIRYLNTKSSHLFIRIVFISWFHYNMLKYSPTTIYCNESFESEEEISESLCIVGSGIWELGSEPKNVHKCKKNTYKRVLENCNNAYYIFTFISREWIILRDTFSFFVTTECMSPGCYSTIYFHLMLSTTNVLKELIIIIKWTVKILIINYIPAYIIQDIWKEFWILRVRW